MTDKKLSAKKYVDYALQKLELDGRNALYEQSRVLEILERAEEETEAVRDEILGELSLSPKQVDDKFRRLLKKDAKQAADWLYTYCVDNHYVQKDKLDRNIRFDSCGLVITVNKAKPEFRDPKQAAAGNAAGGGFAQCNICRENEGYGAKRNLRTVDLTLGGEKWFWQYSPYGYFYQHGIAVNCRHVPMDVTEKTFVRLLDFVDIFPHFFIGSNAALPRIGGSVLAHDHYQGGGEVLPMHRAPAKYVLTSEKYADAVVEVVDWQGTVVRVVSENRDTICDVCEQIRQKWIQYEDKSLGILPRDADGQHNAVSPTAVKTKRGYEMSVILRSNITSETYPDGVFHAHPEFHVIKKESIGLIEAQGLFILPGRLEGQLAEVERCVEGGLPLPRELADFAGVCEQIGQRYEEKPAEGVHAATQYVLGDICNRILQNTAVFKEKEQTVAFMRELGFTVQKEKTSEENI